MATVIQTRSALRDLDGIWDYIAEENPAKASDFIRTLRDRMELLATQPYMGRSREELASGLRSFPMGTYVVFYRVSDDGILVMRVLHSRQDISEDDF